jgi:hypothetical protein
MTTSPSEILSDLAREYHAIRYAPCREHLARLEAEVAALPRWYEFRHMAHAFKAMYSKQAARLSLAFLAAAICYVFCGAIAGSIGICLVGVAFILIILFAPVFVLVCDADEKRRQLREYREWLTVPVNEAEIIGDVLYGCDVGRHLSPFIQLRIELQDAANAFVKVCGQGLGARVNAAIDETVKTLDERIDKFGLVINTLDGWHHGISKHLESWNEMDQQCRDAWARACLNVIGVENEVTALYEECTREHSDSLADALTVILADPRWAAIAEKVTGPEPIFQPPKSLSLAIG